MEQTNLNILLKKIQIIIEKNDEIAKLKGENFNIFSILKLSSNENQLHSRFLKDLLDINGTHGFGSTFLDLFVQYLGKKLTNDFSFETKTSKTEIEKYIGVRNDIQKTGGRIDISIQNENTEIVIENKIYAQEQDFQIERYCNYALPRKGLVLYLTLHGKEPKSNGDYKLNEHFFSISYSHDIIAWLLMCFKEASDFPILRETIKQYILIIKKLTGQLTDSTMNIEVKKMILDNYLSAKQIRESFEDLTNDIISFWSDVTKKISDKTNKVNVNFNNKTVLLDVCNHNRDKLGVYIENIFSDTYLCIWFNPKVYKQDLVNKFIEDNQINWEKNSHFLVKDIVNENFETPESIKKLFDDEKRKELIEFIAQKAMDFANHHKSKILELNEKVKQSKIINQDVT